MKQSNILYVAAKALIKDSGGKVLILKQSDHTISGGNRYHPPGGIIEPGETVQECLKREVKEEIGVECTVERLFDIGEWAAERGGDVMQFIGIFYVCHIASVEYTLQASEVADTHWVGPNEVDLIDIVEPSKSIIKRFMQA